MGFMSNAGVRLKSTLSNRDFMILWFGHAISVFGDMLTFLALPLLVYDVTGSKNSLAFTALLRGAPIILLGLFAGVLVDRWDRKRIMISSDLVRALLTIPIMIVPQEYFVITVYIISFLKSVVGIFFNPALNSTIPAIVKKEDLNNVNSMLALTNNTLSILAPMIGMSIITLFGGRWVLLIDIVSFAVSAIAVYFVKIPAREKKGAVRVNIKTILSDAGAGLGYIRRSKPLLVIMITTMITMFGQGFIGPLWLPYVIQVLGKPATFFAELARNQSIGALIGTMIIMAFGLRQAKSFKKMYSFYVLTTGITIFMQITTGNPSVFIFWGTTVGIFISGMNVSTQTIMQHSTRKDFMGRISSAFFLINQGFYLASVSLTAIVGDLISTKNLLVFACAIWLVGCIIGSMAMLFVKDESFNALEDSMASEVAAEGE